ncbi:hypothetical protein HBB16_14060 [Pseudonocardia sp. MCCB 268]|nr:hypothetical protein [Pseudonocardia cytotoxica]
MTACKGQDAVAAADGARRVPGRGRHAGQHDPVEQFTANSEPAGVHPGPVRPPRCGVLYSSGTTGLPGASCTATAASMLEHLKAIRLARARSQGAVLLVHHHRLDDVELPGREASRSGDDRDVRRRPRPPRPERAVGAGRRARVSLFSVSRAVRAVCMKAGLRPGDEHDLSRDAGAQLHRRAAVGGGVPAGSATRPGSTSDLLGLRRHRRLRGVLTSAPTVPVWLGELSCALGADVRSYGEDGTDLLDDIGELVITIRHRRCR